MSGTPRSLTGWLRLDGVPAASEGRLQALVRLLEQALDLVTMRRPRPAIDDALLGELGRVELPNRGVRFDALGHERLRVRRLVLLVVAVAPVADEVDDDVVSEARAKRHREPDRRDRRLRVVGVHVEDRRVEPLGEIARVARRAPLLRVGRETDLVVRDDVQRAARVIPGKRLQVERLGDHSLAREGRIAVYENCQGGGRIVPGIGCRVIGLSGARGAPRRPG